MVFLSCKQISFVSFRSNYATEATSEAIRSDKLIKNDLADIIDELNKIVSKHSHRRLSQYELKTLLNRMKIQKPTAEQALNILQLCSFGRTDLSVREVVKTIWHELHSDNTNALEFHTEHYNYMLKFGSERQDVNYTQGIFDELIGDGIEPNA